MTYHLEDERSCDRARGCSAQRGFGVIEVMVGLALMAVAVMGLNTLAISMIRGNLSAELNDDATRLAQQRVEQIRRDGYAAAAVGTVVEFNLDRAGNVGGTYRRTTVTTTGTLPTSKRVEVTMEWPDYGTRRTVFYTEIAQ